MSVALSQALRSAAAQVRSVPRRPRTRDRGFSRAEEAARTPRSASVWRRELAEELRTASRAHYAAVLTCPPGDWSQLRHDCDPIGLRHIVEEIIANFVPRIEAAGEDWRFATAHHGLVYTPLETARDQSLARELHETVLAPVGIDGWVVGYFLVGQNLLGFSVLGSDEPSAKLISRCGTPLHALVGLAAQTLSSALDLAEACTLAATSPRTARLPSLTQREREVATLAAQGFANLNSAVRLGISEGTVAVHLRNVYAKLGVHSRVELASVVLDER